MFPLKTSRDTNPVPERSPDVDSCTEPGGGLGSPTIALMRSIVCINGPNLDLLGSRDPAFYGDWTLARLDEQVVAWGEKLDLEVTCRQSNHEGEVVEALHAASASDGVILNPGALTHSSPAVGDAVEACPVPVVEVHLSNVRRRQRWRRRSFISSPAARSIMGRGPEGYRAALRHLVNRQSWPVEPVRYGPHPDQVIDLRRVEGASSAVILVHGGFWSDVWASDTMESWAVELARRGIATANIEYRRLGSGGGAIPTTADVELAIQMSVEWLAVNRFALLGHSAGAHLAAWAAVGGRAKPAATVAMSGIFDLRQAAADGLGDRAAAAFDPSLGTAPEGAGRPGSPMALIHGRDDRLVPAAQSISYARYLEGLGAAVTLDVVDDSHFEMLDPAANGGSVALSRLVSGLG